MNVTSLPCRLITVRADARAVDRMVVKDLKESISRMGMLHPVLVRPKRIWLKTEWVDGYELVAGRHRFQAAQEMEAPKIIANIVELDDVEAELAMIGENLHRNDLTKEERDRSIRRMAELMGSSLVGQNGTPTEVRKDGRRKGPQHELGVASKIAEQTGLSKRTVQRALSPPPTPAPAAEEPSQDEKDEQAYWRMWARMSPAARDRVLKQHAAHGHI